jgi:hypothetical protein
MESKDKIEHLPGWSGKMDRRTAEHRLENKPVGTYLFRQSDECSAATVAQLELSNRMKIRAYLCTIVEPAGGIADVMVLHTSQGWVVYHDNPDLTDSEYVYSQSPYNLLAHIGQKARFPI